MANKVITFDFTKAEHLFERVVRRYIRAMDAEVDAFVGTAAARLRRNVQHGWPVDSGLSRAAWDGPTRVGVAAYRIANHSPYAGVIEFGGYPGVGPKTQRIGGRPLGAGLEINDGIYPKQRPAAPVRRGLAHERPAFVRGLRTIMRKNWRR